MKPELQRLLWARQFVAGPAHTEPRLANFEMHGFAGVLAVAAHTLLSVTRLISPDRELLCLGDMLDPRNPLLDNRGVLSQLLDRSESFAQFEAGTTGLGGRWIIFARIGREHRLYPDAAGLRGVFYGTTEGGLWIGSQPGLLQTTAGFDSDRELVPRLWETPWATAWPAARTPYPGVRQLLPNHYLELSTGLAHRFWPSQSVSSIDPAIAASSIGQLLTGSIRAVVERGGPIALALTGGLDSRTLLASASDMWTQLEFFTIADASTDRYDVWIPRSLAARLGLRFRFVSPLTDGQADGVTELVRTNTGQLWRDPNERHMAAFGMMDARFLLLGTVSEVCRCYYYPNGLHPGHVEPAQLATLAGWGQDPLAVAAFGEWLSEVPDGLNVDPLDLFYWETRVGNWGALSYLALDAFCNPVSPFNCREILELGLSVDVAQRVEPWELYRKICMRRAPDTLELPINSTWLDVVEARLRSLAPPGMRSAVRYIRGLPRSA